METARPSVLGLVHAETSTGARQPLEGVRALCDEFDCLLVVDTVTSLAGVKLFYRRMGHRRCLFRHAKVFELPSWTRTPHAESESDRSSSQADKACTELVSGYVPRR